MMALPQKIAFLRFRDSVSAINRDFHRLRQIAGSGLGAAALWQQRGFTVTIEALAKDAKWWEQLRLLRIPFSDDRYRAEDDYKRGLVPEMLRKTCFDVATVLDFGRDYNIEGKRMLHLTA